MQSDTKESARHAVVRRLELSKQCEILGTKPWKIISNEYYTSCEQPCVSVVITLFNYHEYIYECLDSVCASINLDICGGFEIIVIDDNSTDNSAKLVEDYITKRPDIPICLVKKHLNTGLADARNVGFKLARAPYVFVLDADNWIYPNCLYTLYNAIKNSNYAAVYNIINKFENSTKEALGLISYYEWDVLELIRCPYIDAMAMFDKNIVLDLGGYSTELVEYGWFGWEDYDMWLKLAQANYFCKLVPHILSSYRCHSESMINTTNLYVFNIAQYFLKKFGTLLKQYNNLEKVFGLHYNSALGKIEQEIRPSPLTILQGQLEITQYQLQQAHQRIAAMETSKFWKLRTAWFLVKRRIGLPTNE